MANCNNCGIKLGCGCQKRVSPQGTNCCTHCVQKVIQQEDKIKVNEASDTQPQVVSVKAYIKK